jgi:hypothetical protein
MMGQDSAAGRCGNAVFLMSDATKLPRDASSLMSGATALYGNAALLISNGTKQ